MCIYIYIYICMYIRCSPLSQQLLVFQRAPSDIQQEFLFIATVIIRLAPLNLTTI